MKKVKSVILAVALLISVAVLPTGAFADGTYNNTLGINATQILHQEAIWADATLVGTQTPPYSGGGAGVQYIVKNASGTVEAVNKYSVGEVKITFNLNGYGNIFTFSAKNLRADIGVILKGSIFD